MSTNFLKKIRNRFTRNRKSSYDIETPAAGGHGTVLLRRYDRVPSMYGESGSEHPNILRDFVPAANTQSPSRYHGDLTLPRHFRFRSGHHRTPSNITMPDTRDDIDLYDAIGDHRRSSCSCACANSARKQIPFVPPANNAVHMTLTGTNTSSPAGKIRNAAKDPLPPIIRSDKRKEPEEGKFAVPQEESPRYIGIDDYSNVDFEGEGAPRVVTGNQAARRAAEEHEEESEEDTLRASHSRGKQSSQRTAEVAREAENGILCDESGEEEEARPLHLDPVSLIHGDDDDGGGGRSCDLPVPHLSCRGDERSHPIPCERSERDMTPLSRSAPTSSFHHHMSASLEDSSQGGSRIFPHHSGYHEYKEAHQVLRATSAGKMVDLHDLEVSSSVEDLYAHVPKGAAKTPDTDEPVSCPSEPNTDNEDEHPPPPIPSRNYRSEACCSGPLSPTPCACSHLKDSETGEELIPDSTAAPVIHTQPGHEPIHMTLEEVLEEAKARGIPLEKPASTLNPRHKRTSSTSHLSPTHSPVTLPPKPRHSKHRTQSMREADDARTGKGKFKLKNIFRKSDQDPGLSPPTLSKLRQVESGSESRQEVSDDSHDPLNTSGEASMSERSESVGNNSHCSSTDSGMEELHHSTNSEPTRTINADFIESLRKLKDCGWYWGPLSWDGAEARLDKKPDGSFLVRDSSDDRYILSISFRSQGTTHHTRIEHYKGTFSFFSQPKSHGAGTIIEFIEKAMEHSRSGKFLYFLRPRAPGFPPAPVQLLYPVSRFRIMQSLQHMCRFEILRATRYDHIDKLPLPQKVKDYLRESQYYAEYILDQGSQFMPL